MELQGIVERVTFHSEETGFSVLKIQVRHRRDLVTLVGVAPPVRGGETIEAQGDWVQNVDYGLQFRATRIHVLPPQTLDGMEKYLGSGMIKGVGPHFAHLMVKAFGEKVFQVLDDEPQRLQEVSGIGGKRLAQIQASWKTQQVVRRIMVFLQSHGVSPARAVRIFKVYGDDAIEKVRENPYALARDIPGIGFRSADAMACQMGIAKDSLIRAQAGLSHVLMEAMEKGHCAYPRDSLVKETSELLEVPQERVYEALAVECSEKRLIQERLDNPVEPAASGQSPPPLEGVFLASLHFCEGKVADFLAQRLLHRGLPRNQSLFSQPSALAAQLDRLEKESGLTLHSHQREAIQVALANPVCLITGGPGTGKSTLTRVLVALLEHLGLDLALCSPTGRAAKRLSECTGREAKTLHRLLGFPQPPDTALKVGALLIDEVSMVDLPLFYSLLKRLPPSAQLILIGDPHQLPSVGPGRLLADLVQVSKVPRVQLTQVFRQAAQSRIIRVAHDIHQGRFPDLSHQEGADFFFIPIEEPPQIADRVVELVARRIPDKFGFHPVRDIQVLCPMQRGVLGARALNQALQKMLNPKPPRHIECFGHTFGVGDKVLVLANDYDKEVFNGDVGWIEELDQEEQTCFVQFEGRRVGFDWDELDVLQPAYTLTVHKSQGSEYPAVVMPLGTLHYPMLQRNLVYTALTRGKKLVVMVGQKKALWIALKAAQASHRWTGLSQKLEALLDTV